MDFCLRSPLVQALLGLLSLSAYAPDLAAQAGAAPDVSPGAAALALVHAEPQYVEAERQVPARSSEPAHERSAGEVTGLERQADGGYRYRGSNFVATIAPDGQVQFRDVFFSRPNWRSLPRPNPNPDALPSTRMLPPTDSLRLLPFNMNLLGWLEKKLGNDPYLSERRWFLEQTRPLRESLAERWEQERLSYALNHVWSAQLSLAERKRATFEIWNQSSPGQAGQAVREGVIAFVRERCPQGAACAFKHDELEELNKQRRHTEAFAPYPSKTERVRDDRRAPPS